MQQTLRTRDLGAKIGKHYAVIKVFRVFLLVFHIIITIGMIAIILVQKSEGIGSGMSSSTMGSMFSSRGAKNFLTRGTAVFAALFFANSLLLAFLAGRDNVLSKKAPIENIKTIKSRNK